MFFIKTAIQKNRKIWYNIENAENKDHTILESQEKIMKSRITINRRFVRGEIDPRIYGGFIEHLGRAVYEGIYQPEHELADEDGFRTDVLNLIKELDMPLTRYPGGNFVSGYRWEDGVGPRDSRPVRLDVAWKAIEPNSFGTGEFMKWCRKAGTEPMLAVNLGTRGPAEAQQLVEYCNFPKGSTLSDWRRSHGAEEPYGVKLWCLGNEMDGVWQIGHKDADAYGRIACEAAKMMKWTDPTIQLIACGSSDSSMKTFGEWEETVLMHTYEQIDYLSIHKYFANRCGMTPGYLALPEQMAEYIDKVVACCDAVGAKKKSRKKIMLSFDEWNVWFHTKWDINHQEWRTAKPLIEDIYDVEDALQVGMLLMTLINHSDRVRIACIAQSVNVIAPIIAPKHGKAWRQTIFFPFALTSRYGRGTTLQAVVDSPEYDAEFRYSEGEKPVVFEKIPYLYCACIHSAERGEIVIFAANRNLEEEMDVSVDPQGFKVSEVIEHQCLCHADRKAVNSEGNEMIRPFACDGAHMEHNQLKVRLPPASWNMIRLKSE